jgi:hypothetical protein
MASTTPRLWAPRGPGQCEGLSYEGGPQCGLFAAVGLPEVPYCFLHIPDELRPIARARVLLWNELAPELWARVLAAQPPSSED